MVSCHKPAKLRMACPIVLSLPRALRGGGNRPGDTLPPPSRRGLVLRPERTCMSRSKSPGETQVDKWSGLSVGGEDFGLLTSGQGQLCPLPSRVLLLRLLQREVPEAFGAHLLRNRRARLCLPGGAPHASTAKGANNAEVLVMLLLLLCQV